jgi:hypothetical protein
MNSWGYLLLITALLVLAGLMLYARFTTRSREKSLHHAPFDWGFGSPALDLPSSEVEPRDSAVRAQLRPDRATGDEEASAAAPPPRDYLDELQEAAAGLAKLMRSSPAARPDPVVYAPPAEAEASHGGVTEETNGSNAERSPEVSEAVAAPAVPEVSVTLPVVETVGQPEAEATTESALVMETERENKDLSPATVDPDAAGEAVFVSMETPPTPPVSNADSELAEQEEPSAPVVLSLRERLGDAVVDQFERIDAGLDALEELVASIGKNLLLLTDYERVEEDSDSEGEELARVADAA